MTQFAPSTTCDYFSQDRLLFPVRFHGNLTVSATEPPARRRLGRKSPQLDKTERQQKTHWNRTSTSSNRTRTGSNRTRTGLKAFWNVFQLDLIRFKQFKTGSLFLVILQLYFCNIKICNTISCITTTIILQFVRPLADFIFVRLSLYFLRLYSGGITTMMSYRYRFDLILFRLCRKTSRIISVIIRPVTCSGNMFLFSKLTSQPNCKF